MELLRAFQEKVCKTDRDFRVVERYKGFLRRYGYAVRGGTMTDLNTGVVTHYIEGYKHSCGNVAFEVRPLATNVCWSAAGRIIYSLVISIDGTIHYFAMENAGERKPFYSYVPKTY